jgi:hypothetical protein
MDQNTHHQYGHVQIVASTVHEDLQDIDTALLWWAGSIEYSSETDTFIFR